MIATPTTAQILLAIRQQLQDEVLPALADDLVIVNVQMMITLLDNLAVRAEHEHEWMMAEADAIVEVVGRITASIPAPPELVTVLDSLSARSPGTAADSVRARYDDASRALSLAAEAAFEAHDGEAQAEVFALLEQRLRNEQAVVGVFSAVGRG